MEQIFEKINALFYEYLKALNLDNTENARLTIEQKIILAVWESNKSYRDYSLEVVETTRASLKYFPNSEALKNGIPFSRYLFNALSNSINTYRDKEALADKNGGMYISDDKYRQIKKIAKTFAELKKIHHDLDDSSIIEKAAAILGKDPDEITDCLKLSQAAKTGIDVKNEDGEEYSVLDTILDENEKNSLESWLVNKEKQEYIFRAIQKAWEKKSDPMLSELLTVKVLQAYLDIENMEDYTFLNKEIYNSFLKDSKYKLPEDSEIAEKYKLTKAAASKTLSRFWDSLKKS